MANILASENNVQNGMEVDQVAVVLVPLPAQGHLNQLLHLSRLVSAYDIPVHFAGTTTYARPRSLSANKLPGSGGANKNTKKKQQKKFGSHLNFPRHRFYTKYRILLISKYIRFFFIRIHWEVAGKPVVHAEAEILKETPSSDGFFTPKFSEFSKSQRESKKFNSRDLYNASRVVEGLYLDLLAKEKTTGTDKLWAIGLLNPVVIPERKDPNNHHKCLEWLDKQPLNSVIFVSFGSTSSFSNEQIKEIALGL
ncbi:Glycosyltransferase [Abeliophyllum distichum]|uniref:Glycosyltransferase n=1 Tax=Abeliophyllum distichum TaxID=126358 RepID=A0ABD1PQ60_9LAMI